ncbi:hypothetical protein BKI52_36480 [marine bacterium AO1-C]|nr:hypothetical protein BKI52_36480 [marine bacterium AO1-C]
MELLGNLRDFQAPVNKFRNFPEEEYASLNHAQHLNKLTHQRMKVVHQLGKAIVHYRQLRAKFLSLAMPYLDTIRLAEKQENEQATENSLLELDYWQEFGEGRIYKAMIERARQDAQHQYTTYQDISLKLEVLQQTLDEQGIQVSTQPNKFLNFDQFQHIINKP